MIALIFGSTSVDVRPVIAHLRWNRPDATP
jgi:hypothetical protein